MYKLYGADTANGHKAAIVLEELGLSYEVVSIDLMSGEHQSSGFKEVNAVSKIPVLELDANRVYGSLAIALDLCEAHGKLLPPGPRGRFYEALAVVATDLAPALSGQFMFSHIIEDKPASAIGYFTQESHRYLQALESYLHADPFLAGEQYTLADALAYPNVAVSARRLLPDAEFSDRYPALSAWQQRLEDRPAIVSGMNAFKA